MVNGVKERVRTMWEAARTTLRWHRGGSDYRRWGDPRSLSPDWDLRTQQIARLIPQGASVLEFGAGRMTLRAHLPDGCKYTPSDLIDRGSGTIVCDLNARELPAFPAHDVAVFSGVLEYINDIDYLLNSIAQSVRVIIASYAVHEQVPGKLERRSHGWVNDYTSGEFEALFLRSGFRRDRVESWRGQAIYRFVREDAGGGTSAGSGVLPPPRGEQDEGSVEEPSERNRGSVRR
jgi:hypothetical protein